MLTILWCGTVLWYCGVILWCGPVLWYCGVVITVDVVDVVVVVVGSAVVWTCAVVLWCGSCR